MIKELKDFLFKGNVLDLAVSLHLSLTQLLRLLTLKTSLNCHGTVSHTVAS